MNIYLDIETLPTDRKVIQERIAADIGPPANYSKPETINKWLADNFEPEYKKALGKTALDGTWGRIACIGWAVDDGPVHVSFAGSEYETVALFWNDLHSTCKAKSNDSDWWMHSKFIGHNVADFDIRFMWQRTRILGIKPTFPLPLDRFSRNVYDTMREWAGYNKFIKCADLELAFGIERNDPLVNGGADVATANVADITAHCAEDVRIVREIYRRMTL